ETNRNDTNREIEKPHPEIDQAIEAWNAMAQNNGLSKVIKVTDSRRKKMKKIVEEYGSEGWRKILEEITQSEFLLGNNGRNWKITIDWLLNTTNLTKVVEGQYRGSDPRKERFQGKDFSHLEWKGII
ncbi:MAG: hypothetical protein Q4Q17_01235, partial [Tissierellia bacterium]|nr:hypothetical protein [Tissierellia bacterium]